MDSKNESGQESRGPDSVDASNFWARYNKLADTHDSDMLGRLNGNLDVLLIFVSDFLLLCSPHKIT